MKGTAGPSASLRFGRDDTSVLGSRLGTGVFGWEEGRTADPSASLGMTKGRGALSGKVGSWMKGTAGPSTTLRSGRDDKGWGSEAGGSHGDTKVHGWS